MPLPTAGLFRAPYHHPLRQCKVNEDKSEKSSARAWELDTGVQMREPGKGQGPHNTTGEFEEEDEILASATERRRSSRAEKNFLEHPQELT